ncbi:MAG: D-alanyl-D-alanine carboxypeptidase/D-alanyl-D-alanine-endopeptidase [Burkholderiaceae bacterium]|jgi:D-alanyl-D-alanine carboxypeptidase/D-alanyl-D-alanine-endopeptidase (penicillin-binding protein 4)|nr:D-alanyl-D-alanine carboxypeptidase/D-alanyl-D-alanine-endopeptidase [Burkholderiaceae bacterium]
MPCGFFHYFEFGHFLRRIATPTMALMMLCAFVLALPVSAAARPKAVARAAHRATVALPPEVARALARAGVPAAHVAMVVVPIVPPGAVGSALTAQAAPRLIWRADAPMNPASVMKLVTTYAGLNLLGPDYLWQTRVYTQGEVTGGVLRGNLVIEGGGDPKLVVERLTALMQAIQAQGVRAVHGDILLSNRVFDLPPHDPAAFDGDPLEPYNVGPDGLLVNFGALVFKFFPDPATGRVRVETEPPIAGVQIPAEVPGAPGACGNWREQLALDFRDAAQVRFAGAYPLTCGDQQWPVAYPEAAQFAPRVIDAVWRASGGALTGQVRWLNGPLPAHIKPLFTGDSLPLTDIIADINKFSNDVMAQQLFLTLSVAGNGGGRYTGLGRGSFVRSRARVARWWRDRFGLRAAPTLENGAGLSRVERISAASLIALLRQAANDPAVSGPFIQSLSVAGVDGTMARLAVRHPGSVAIGRAELKTGTLRDVAAVAGYAQGRSGRTYAVVGLVNDPNAPAARTALDRLVEWAIKD